jgi:hypothetical protein
MPLVESQGLSYVWLLVTGRSKHLPHLNPHPEGEADELKRRTDPHRLELIERGY